MHLSHLTCSALLLLCAASACRTAEYAPSDHAEKLSRPALASARSACLTPQRARCSPNDSDFVEASSAKFVKNDIAPATLALDSNDQSSSYVDHSAAPKWAMKPTSEELARREGRFRVAQGWYASLGGAYASFSTEHLNGTSTLVGGDTIVLPEPDSGTGGTASLGYRFDRMAFEFFYLQTDQDAVQTLPAPSTQFDTTFKSFGLNLRHYFHVRGRFQPFISLGLASNQFVIKNGATLGAVTADATLEDELTLNAGAGFSLFLSSRFSLNLYAENRFFNDYFEAEGVAPKGGTSKVNGSGINVVGSLSYIF